MDQLPNVWANCQHCWHNPVQTTFKGVPVCKPCKVWLNYLSVLQSNAAEK